MSVNSICSKLIEFLNAIFIVNSLVYGFNKKFFFIAENSLHFFYFFESKITVVLVINFLFNFIYIFEVLISNVVKFLTSSKRIIINIQLISFIYISFLDCVIIIDLKLDCHYASVYNNNNIISNNIL